MVQLVALSEPSSTGGSPPRGDGICGEGRVLGEGDDGRVGESGGEWGGKDRVGESREGGKDKRENEGEVMRT